MSGPRLLLLRRAGGLWGVVQDAVRTVRGEGDELTILLAGEVLVADEVLGVVEGLTVSPAGGALESYWGAATGLAVWRGTPLVVVDATRPPSCLWPKPTEKADDDERDADD